MLNSRRAAAGIMIAAAMLLSACALAPEATDENLRKDALERWNDCLVRYDTNIEHYCDGHRRDLLATFPTHHQRRINGVLVKRTQAISKARALRKVLDTDPEEQ